MEEIEKNPEEASEASMLSENQKAQSGISTQRVEEDPGVKLNKEFKERKSQPKEESEKFIAPQRIINLQGDLVTLVTNIQTAADAKESMRRTELEEARRLRYEQLENDIKSSQEKFEEITGGWSSAKQKVIPQELQVVLNNQQELCTALIEDKKKLINYLQQELKIGDDHYVKDLRKQAEELDLMMERMEDQIKTLTNAYREELAQIERVYQQESDVLFTRDKTEWEQYMKELWDKELERLAQRKKQMEENDAIVQNHMLETAEKISAAQMEDNAKIQVLEREQQQIKGTRSITKIKQFKQEDKVAAPSLAHMKSRIMSLQTERKNLLAKYTSQEQELTKRIRYLSEDYKRNIQQYECIQKKIKHFAAADVRKFEEMWSMLEAEAKQLVERALVIDSLICKQHLGLTWERPPVPVMKLFGPIQPKKEALRCNQRVVDASVGPKLETVTESTDMAMYKEGTAVQSESSAEVEEGWLPTETVKKVMKLLCNEAGFLMEDKLLNLLATLDKEQQTVEKLSSLLYSFGIEDEDFPKLAHFLIKYKHPQREQTEGVESGGSSDKTKEVTNSRTHLTSELTDPNNVVPAVKRFLGQLTTSRESSDHQHPTFQQVDARDASEDKAYWGSLGNIISEDKLKVWDAAENTLKQYHAVLTEISELVPETQSLEQQNKELRMLLQSTLNSGI